MKLISILILFIGLSAAARDTYVQGYYKSNGTYVQPHYRSAPNNTVTDNYSYQGNTNPYTGNAGTVNPYDYTNNNQQPKSNNQINSNNSWGR